MILKEIVKSKWYIPGLLSLLQLLPIMMFGQTKDLEGMAGPDKNTCFNPETGLPQAVKIGLTSISGWCYTWTPSTGLDDPHSPTPMAAPWETTTYHLKIVFDNFDGEYNDDMVVRVNEGVNSITATPKRCCFKAGDTYTIDMFNITTDPSGMESRIKFDPPQVPTQNDYQYNTTVTLSASGCVGGEDVTCDVTVNAVNEGFVSSFVLGFPVKYMEKLDKAFTKINGILELMNEGIATKIPLCAPDPPGWSYQYKYSEGLMCCPENDPCPDSAYSGSLGCKLQGGITCDFPFYGVPYIASINVRVQAQLALSITGNYKTLCNGFELCVPLGITGAISGGFSATIFAKAGMDASLVLRGTATAEPVKVCISPTLKIEGSTKVCTNVDIVGTVTLFSLIQAQGVWPVVGKSCFPLF